MNDVSLLPPTMQTKAKTSGYGSCRLALLMPFGVRVYAVATEQRSHSIENLPIRLPDQLQAGLSCQSYNFIMLRGLLAVRQPTYRGQSRCSGLNFRELSGCTSFCPHSCPRWCVSSFPERNTNLKSVSSMKHLNEFHKRSSFLGQWELWLLTQMTLLFVLDLLQLLQDASIVIRLLGEQTEGPSWTDLVFSVQNKN